MEPPAPQRLPERCSELISVTYDLWKWFQTVHRGALRYFWILVKIWKPQEVPHGAPSRNSLKPFSSVICHRNEFGTSIRQPETMCPLTFPYDLVKILLFKFSLSYRECY